MHIHGAAVAKEIKAPDLLQQLFPGEYPVLMSGQKMFSFLNPSNTVSIIKSVTSVCQSMLPIRVISGFVISSESAAANSDTASIGSRFNNASSFLITDPSHKK